MLRLYTYVTKICTNIPPPQCGYAGPRRSRTTIPRDRRSRSPAMQHRLASAAGRNHRIGPVDQLRGHAVRPRVTEQAAAHACTRTQACICTQCTQACIYRIYACTPSGRCRRAGLRDRAGRASPQRGTGLLRTGARVSPEGATVPRPYSTEEVYFRNSSPCMYINVIYFIRRYIFKFFFPLVAGEYSSSCSNHTQPRIHN